MTTGAARRMRNSELAVSLSCALLIAIPSAAKAQDTPAPDADNAPSVVKPGDDEITLKNGGVLRGTVISIDPNHEVVIAVAGSAEPRHIPWAELAVVNRGKFAAHTSQPPVIQAPKAPAPLAQADGTPLVHVIADSPKVQLRLLVSSWSGVMWGPGGGYYSGSSSSPVCMAPCDKVVDAGSQMFFFDGSGITRSSEFQLSGLGPEVTINVNSGSSALRGGGIAMIVIGAVASVVGAFAVGIGYLAEPQDQPSKTGGGVAIGTGLAMVGGGIAMMVGARTTYSFVTPGAQAIVPLRFEF